MNLTHIFVDTIKSRSNKKINMSPSMPLEELSVHVLDILSASNGIEGGEGCNCIYFAKTLQVPKE